MKKEKNPVLVVFCIIILLLFIILPPIFRKYIPKQENTNTNIIKDKLQILNCNKVFNDELYSVSSKTKYVNNSIEKNTITYQKITEAQSTTAEVPITRLVTVADEYSLFQSLVGITPQINDSITTITIDNNIIQNNPNNELLSNYFQDLINQKKYYESMGYTCNVLES